MADIKSSQSSGRYGPKGDIYKDDAGVTHKTLPRRKAGWQHILERHEAKK